MSRRIKLDFEPLSLDETAKRLGVPPARAREIFALIGVDNKESSTASRTRKTRTGSARNTKVASR